MSDVSIWRFAITDDLEALFKRLVQADDQGFQAIAHELMMEGFEDLPSLDDIERDTEARLRAMDLPEDIKETMLRGFRNSMAEAREEEAEDTDDDFDPDADGHPGLALASSHMFYDDPYASLEYEEIDRQVNDVMARYRDAASAAFGDPGQSFAAFLGVSQGQLWDDDTFDTLMEAGLDAVIWVWAGAEQVHFLSQWQEDKELPIDLEFGRMPRAVFDQARLSIGGT